MALLAQNSRMVCQSFGIGDAVQLTIDGFLPVHNDLDSSAHDDNLFAVPLARRLQRPTFGGADLVDRAVVLARLQVCVLRRGVVEHLNLHPDVGRVALKWGANPDAVVAAR